ncbi:MAG: DNRLRE domain-containing protein [Candidatus Atabeyarchaeum deiterrae]
MTFIITSSQYAVASMHSTTPTINTPIDKNSPTSAYGTSFPSQQHPESVCPSPPDAQYQHIRSADWDEWRYNNGTRVRNIYLAPRYVFNPLNNSWCDWLLARNGTGISVATSRVCAYIEPDAITLYTQDYAEAVATAQLDWPALTLSSNPSLSVKQNSSGVYVTESYPSSSEVRASVNVTYSFLPGSPLKIGFLVRWMSDTPCSGLQINWRISLARDGYYTYGGNLAGIASQTSEVKQLLAPSTRTNSYLAIQFYDYNCSQSDGANRNLSKYFLMGVDWSDAKGSTIQAALNPMDRSFKLTFGNFTLNRGEITLIDPTVTTLLGSGGDSTIDSSSPDSNNGFGSSASIMALLTRDDYYTAKIIICRFYMKFSLQSLPLYSSISSAKICLFLYATSSTARYIAAHNVQNNNWNENSIYWNDCNDPGDPYYYNSTPTSTISVGTATQKYYNWSVTSDARNGLLYDQGKAFSECFKYTDESNAPVAPNSIHKNFISKDGGSHLPILSVTYTYKAYAVLIGSGGDALGNYARFYNDLMFMYDTLKSYCSYTDSEIYVLYADGNTPSSNNCYDPGNAVPHVNVIDYNATKAALRTVFADLASKSDNQTFILIFMTGHGDHTEQESYTVSFSTWGQYIWDYEFANATYLGRITSYDAECIVMEQCYSGGFTIDLQNGKRIIYTAVDHKSPSHSGSHNGHEYDEFAYWFTDGLIHGDRPPYDGIIKLHEAWDYANSNDTLDRPGPLFWPQNGFDLLFTACGRI